MNIRETQLEPIKPLAPAARLPLIPLLQAVRRLLLVFVTAYLVILLAGGSAPTAELLTLQRLHLQVDGYGFGVIAWEMGALGKKVEALFTRPEHGLTEEQSSALAQQYLQRARRIGELEGEISRRLSQSDRQQSAATQALQHELTRLRHEQETVRPAVEAILQNQVTSVLAEEGLGVGKVALPPVEFAFVEPPQKLVVSPRERIETIYGEMLDTGIPLAKAEQIERDIRQEQKLSAYVTSIGGLGAYPTMVIDNADLPWILSTIAHEWTHNYLTFFPLGFNYGVTSDNIIINETVAELVGTEIGEKVLRRYYPELVPPPATPASPPAAEPATPALPRFDFDTEMRNTRLRVDELLAAGQVDEAERYMEARRQFFVHNGYPLRVLNQAFFAFHGSYGTGPASTSPLGPKLERLRTLTPNVKTFLQVVRSFTTPEDVDRALATWKR